jgi:hypothetical protein
MLPVAVLKDVVQGVDYVFYLLQLKRLKLRKNNWDCETYQFDEVLTETASQKRVYEVVAKPVVEVRAFFSWHDSSSFNFWIMSVFSRSNFSLVTVHFF